MKHIDQMHDSKQRNDDPSGIQPVSTASALMLIIVVVLIITFITAGMCGNMF